MARLASALSIRESEASAARFDWNDVICFSRSGKAAAKSRDLAKRVPFENKRAPLVLPIVATRVR
jgi:hypothetical protein